MMQNMLSKLFSKRTTAPDDHEVVVLFAAHLTHKRYEIEEELALPASKTRVARAIERELKKTTDPVRREDLGVLYVSLADYQQMSAEEEKAIHFLDRINSYSREEQAKVIRDIAASHKTVAEIRDQSLREAEESLRKLAELGVAAA
tara:strand:- start:41 stop:478 length:438 start_codon:yes stop_codon:yes gene_type:complete